MLGRLATLAALAVAPLAYAQTYTECNPLEKTCSPDSGLETSSFDTDFTKGAATGWSLAAGTTLSYGSKGAEFTIAKDGQAPTIQTDFHILFGTVEVTMQAAPGTGIVSSIVLESSDLDEIDWEFLGGDATQVETNYFGKGDTTTYDRAIYYPVSSPQTTVHTYRVDWSPSRLIYYVDGNQVRVLNYADAKSGTRYPQTPMRIKLGNWAGGAPGSPAGTVEWAGGATDFSQAPFTMYVQSVKITNMYPAKDYVWGDKSGTWQSIKAVQGDGTSSVKSTSDDDSSKATADDSKKSDPKTTVAAAVTSANVTERHNHTKTSNSTLITATAKPVNLNGNHTSTTLKTTDKTTGKTTTGKATPAVAAATSSSSSTSNSSSTPISSAKSAASSTSPAVTGIILIFTFCMCLWML